MAGIDNVLRQLQEEHRQTKLQLGKLQEAISAIEGLSVGSSGSSRDGSRPKRTLSLAARRRIAQAQKARWAKFRKSSPSTSTAKKRGKRIMSVAARRKIAAAQRARWAIVKRRERKAA